MWPTSTKCYKNILLKPYTKKLKMLLYISAYITSLYCVLIHFQISVGKIWCCKVNCKVVLIPLFASAVSSCSVHTYTGELLIRGFKLPTVVFAARNNGLLALAGGVLLNWCPYGTQ